MSGPGIKPTTWIGTAKETIWGTGVAATQYLRLVSEGLKEQKDQVKSKAARQGYLPNTRFTPKRAEGDVTIESAYAGREIWLRALFGYYSFSADTPMAGVNTHVFKFDPANNDFPQGISLEPYRGIADAGKGHRFLGMLPHQLVFDLQDDDILTEAWSFYGRNEERITPSATTPSFNDEDFIMGKDSNVLTFSGGTSVTMRNGKITFAVPRDNNRPDYGSQYKGQPIVIGMPTAGFEGEIEWDTAAGVNASALLDFYLNDSNPIAGVTMSWEGGQIGATATNYGMTITLPMVKVIGDEPNVDNNEGIVTMPLKLDVMDPDGSSAPSITLINDSAEVTA